MDFILKCFIFVTLTSASAYKRDFWSAGSLEPQRSLPDTYQLHSHNYQLRYPEEPPPDRTDERQRMNERSIAVNSGVQRGQELGVKMLQTRDDAFPRAENRSYYNIVNVNPKPYPVIASRRGEVEIPDLPPSYVPDIPENCKKLGICERINNYPHDVVDIIFSRIREKSSKLKNVDVLEQPENLPRQGSGEDNIELCKINETVVFPQAAQTEDGKWYVILNPDGVKLQGFRMQICDTTKKCATLIEFLNGYTARCKQKYIQRAMAAVDVDKSEIIYDKLFRVLMVIKTLKDKVEGLIEFVKKNSPFEDSELDIISAPIGKANIFYLEFMNEMTTEEDSD